MGDTYFDINAFKAHSKQKDIKQSDTLFISMLLQLIRNNGWAFLSEVEPEGFALANSLLSGKSLDECKFNDVVTALTTHYTKNPYILTLQVPNEKAGKSIADYVTGIKTLAHTCDYKDNLDMFRDSFVIGLSNRHTQQILLTEADVHYLKKTKA